MESFLMDIIISSLARGEGGEISITHNGIPVLVRFGVSPEKGVFRCFWDKNPRQVWIFVREETRQALINGDPIIRVFVEGKLCHELCHATDSEIAVEAVSEANLPYYRRSHGCRACRAEWDYLVSRIGRDRALANQNVAKWHSEVGLV